MPIGIVPFGFGGVGRSMTLPSGLDSVPGESPGLACVRLSGMFGQDGVQWVVFGNPMTWCDLL